MPVQPTAALGQGQNLVDLCRSSILFILAGTNPGSPCLDPPEIAFLQSGGQRTYGSPTETSKLNHVRLMFEWNCDAPSIDNWFVVRGSVGRSGCSLSNDQVKIPSAVSFVCFCKMQRIFGAFPHGAVGAFNQARFVLRRLHPSSR